jgi:hypothetical protein
MVSRVSLILLAGLCLNTAAHAATAAKPSEPMPGTSVEMPYLIAPITVDDKLVSYAYIAGKIVASSPSAAIDVRARLPFVQDAFVRDVNAEPVATANSVAAVDLNALSARLLGDARRIVGADKVASIAIVSVQLSPLKPADTTGNPQ